MYFYTIFGNCSYSVTEWVVPFLPAIIFYKVLFQKKKWTDSFLTKNCFLLDCFSSELLRKSRLEALQ